MITYDTIKKALKDAEASGVPHLFVNPDDVRGTGAIMLLQKEGYTARMVTVTNTKPKKRVFLIEAKPTTTKS